MPQTIPAAKSFDYDQIKAKFTNDEELTQAESLYWEQFQGDFQSGNAPSRPPRDDEGGPDDFGYTWKDSEEDGGPEYEWIDITEDGDRLNPSDDWNSGPLELGFEFTWYDRETDVIRVCSNGWITFDENDNNRTYPLPRCPTANAPNAVVSVNGYDLNPTQGGGQMWYWTNEEDMAIVSWINVPRWANNNIVQTMQVIIHGNGVVILQYGELRNLNYGGDCNVGFESWNGQDGLSIGYHQNNMPSEDYAIRIGARMGWVEGVVTDLETEDAIAEVEVLLSDGSVTNTDEDGFFILSDISEEEGYTITASKPGFNTVVSEEFEVLDAETTVVEMALPHPEIRANVEAFEKELAQRAIENDEFQIINEGNGDLEFEMKYSVPVRRDDPGDIIFEFNASEITGDSRLKGVTTDGSNLYFTGANNGENPNKVYVVTLEGELERDFDQPVEDPSSNGMKGVVFDGTYLYAADGQEIVKFTTDGEAIDAIEGPFNPTQYLAYDPESDHFWVCSTSSSIVEIDREGNVITELDSDVRKYGITWHPNDLEGYNIYLSVRVRDGSNCVIMKVHPESGEVRFVMDITNGEDDKLSDCHLTNAFNPLVWAFIVIVEVGIPDFVRTHELSLNTSWVEVDPMEGTVEPESELDIEVTFDAGNWVPGTYELLLLIESNAAGDPINIPLTLDVSDEGLEMQFYEFLETERRHSFVIQSVILRGEAAIFGDEIGVF
ncbi:carboxypeptidase regulatory-like domain-containing protein, partial [bacterium]|nr:carboxypeptidase regulatory-like domain-containing protein [bacterium]